MSYTLKDWWQECGKEEQRQCCARTQVIRRIKRHVEVQGKKLNLEELRQMSTEELKRMSNG